MTTQSIIAIIFLLTTLSSYINYRFFKLPAAIGITLFTLILSIIFVLIDQFIWDLNPYVQPVLTHIDFNKTFMDGMLSFLLFAGSLQININDLAKEKVVIILLTTVGVILSTFIIGFLVFYITNLLHIYFPLIDCLTFGALISPTDPIAVLASLKNANAPKKLEVKIAGESLFNDGIGIVMFVIMVSFYSGNNDVSYHGIILLFFQQLCGGILFGLILAGITKFLLKGIYNLQVVILITLSLVTSGYLLAIKLGVSGPIAIVVAGLSLGSALKHGLIPKKTVQFLAGFWEMIDEVLNALLFVLIGLELLNINLSTTSTLLALTAIPIVLIARYISVAGPLMIWGRYRDFKQKAITIMTWGGLRGGVSIALALSLPEGPVKDEVIAITYSVVVFSILVQGLTIKRLIKFCLK